MNVTMLFIYKFRGFIFTVTRKQITILVKGKWREDFIVIENILSNGRSIFVWYIYFEFFGWYRQMWLYCFTIQDTIKVHIFLLFMDKWQSEIYNMFWDRFFKFAELWIESKNIG